MAVLKIPSITRSSTNKTYSSALLDRTSFFRNIWFSGLSLSISTTNQDRVTVSYETVPKIHIHSTPAFFISAGSNLLQFLGHQLLPCFQYNSSPFFVVVCLEKFKTERQFKPKLRKLIHSST